MANLLEGAVPPLTSRRGNFMIWEAASVRRLDFPLFLVRSLAGQRRRSLSVNVGKANFVAIFEGWWLHGQIERLQDWFCCVFLRRTRFLFFFFAQIQKSPMSPSHPLSSNFLFTLSDSSDLTRCGASDSCLPPSHHPSLPASLCRET